MGLDIGIGIKKVGRIECERGLIGWEEKICGEFEWWKIMIGWKENIGEKVIIFWDKYWMLKIVIF